MPITVFEDLPEEKKGLIEKLSTETDFLFDKIKRMKNEDALIKNGIDLLQTRSCDFADDSKPLRQIFVFIAMLAIENNSTLRNMLLSKSEVEDLPLIKNGVTTLQEGCKKLIGFYVISTKDGSISEAMIRNSMLYQFHSKFKLDNPLLYAEFERHINNFRDKLEVNNTKTLRDKLIHYQKDNKEEFDPFDFVGTILEIDRNEVYQILFDYCIFLRFIAGYINNLMILGYR